MAFVVKKKIHGKTYYYLNENKRVPSKIGGTKVKTKTIAYLGKTRKEAEQKKKMILENKKKELSEKKLVFQESEKKINEKSYKNQEKEITKISIDELATFCKRKGFVYQSGEIYGGLAGFWDFGPLGVEIKNNIKKEWWKFHVEQRDDVVGIDGSIITHPKVWEASGHVDNFVDYWVIDKKTGEKFKIDLNERDKYENSERYEIQSAFNLMFSTNIGPDITKGSTAFLRPETAQLIFTNFKFVYENSRLKLPCGIAQIGKAFRNEIAPRDFLFRSREFEQMEIEYFVDPFDEKCPYEIPSDVEIFIYSAESQEKNLEAVKMRISEALKKRIIKKDWHAYWLATEFLWFKNLGANPEKFRIRQHLKNELSHYSSDTWDLEYEFPFGWKEIQGIADRGDYDLMQHEKFSKKDLKIFDEKTGKKLLPHVVCEPSMGAERAFLVFMFDSYFYDQERDNVVLKLHPRLAPIKASILPIVKTNQELLELSRKVYETLKKKFNVNYDSGGSIGRRYARNDEIGTPFCITIDEESLKKNDVTIRERDTTQQIRVKIKELGDVISKLIFGEKNLSETGKLVNTRKKFK